MASISSWPRYLRIAFSAERRKYALLMPGISTGYWNARKRPSQAASSGFIASRSLPLKRISPPVTSYVSRRASTCASVLLPEPFGPMIECTSPAFSCQVDAFEDFAVLDPDVQILDFQQAHSFCPSGPRLPFVAGRR